MNTTWICESCCTDQAERVTGASHNGQNFSRQEDLVEHIKRHHLSKKIERGHTVFMCTYGTCNNTKGLPVQNQLSRTVTFDSEYDYEYHIVTVHLVNSNRGNPYRKKNSHVFQRAPHNWTQYDSVINMAAVLNDPADRQLDIFSRYWGDAFERTLLPPCKLPVITEECFFPYLASLAKRKSHKVTSRLMTPTVSSQICNLDPNSPFYSPKFDLSDPKIFNSVIPLQRHCQFSNVTEAFIKQSDQLSQHLDTVELSIINHVTERSPAFFEAVRSHDLVRQQLSHVISQVKAIRSRLNRIDTVYCQGAGQIARLACRRTNLRTLLAQLDVLASVHSTQPTIQSLLKSNDFCSALDLTTGTQETLAAMRRDNGGGGFACLSHMDAQLTEVAKFINLMVGNEFELALRSVLNSPAISGDEGTAEQITPSVLGLQRIGQTGFVATLKTEVKMALRDALERSLNCPPTDQWKLSHSGGARNPQIDLPGENSFKVWLNLLKRACAELESTLNRLRSIILSIESSLMTSTACQPPSPGSVSGEGLRLVYWEAADWSQHQLVASILPSHLRQSELRQAPSVNSFTSADAFVEFAQILERFHKHVIVEAWSFYQHPTSVDLPLQSAVLRSLVSTHASVFLQNFHTSQCKHLDEALSREPWRPASRGLSSAILHSLDHLLAHQELCDDTAGTEGLRCVQSESSASSSSSSSSPSSELVLQGEAFSVVGAVLTFVSLMFDYLRLSEQLTPWPLLLRECRNCLAKFLTMFNSRSCELVLGAGACRLKVLGKISARNLALVVRSLQVLLVILPALRTFYEKGVHRFADCSLSSPLGRSSSHSLATDKHAQADPFFPVEQAIRAHEAQVIDKLTHLLASVISGSFGAWQPRPPTPSAEIRTVCQALTKLTKMASDVLSPDLLTNLLLRVHVEFKASLRQRLSDLSLFPDGGPQQGLVDSEVVFYMTCLRGLTPSLAHLADDCDEIWPSRSPADC